MRVSLSSTYSGTQVQDNEFTYVTGPEKTGLIYTRKYLITISVFQM